MKHHSKKFWILFVIGSLIFLSGWFVFWEVRHNGLESFRRFLGLLPVKQEMKTDLDTVISLSDALLHTDGQEKVFLILFQNNLELRPGGGFIGSFGILKVRDGVVTDFAVHDTSNFDGRIPDTIAPPYPMKETLKIPSWKFRDSNYSPDFPENAKWAQTFYQMGQGGEHFDGIIAVTGNVLSSFLRVTGPVTVEGFPGTYGAESAIIDLETQVEQNYRKQNITVGERKSVMNLWGMEVLRQVKTLSLTKKYELFQVILADLHSKDIQIQFADPLLERDVVAAGWDGAMDGAWHDDYLFLVDANLNAWKSDYYVKRSFHYSVDLTKESPEATLSVTYKHTATAKDWLTKDYQSYLRVYVPAGSFLADVSNAATKPVYGEFLGKKYFGVLVQVPLGTEKTVTFHYALPKNIEKTWYDLKVEKQAGVSDVPVTVTVLHPDGTKEEKSFVLNRTAVLSAIK